MARRGVGTVLVATIVVLLVVVVVLPAVTPVRLGYVTSGSMQPTLEPGDGYVAVPAGNVTEGEIVIYWSPARQEYVTHRVVDARADGFVTKGDANAMTDQEMGEPLVPRSAIVAAVLTVGGSPVVLPGLGGVVSTVQRFRVPLLGVLLALVAALFVGFRRRRRGDRNVPSVLRVRDVAVPILLVVFLTLVAVMPLGVNSYQLTYVATADADRESEIPVGESVTRNVSVPGGSIPLTTTVVRGNGMTVLEYDFNGSRLDLRVSIPPPEMAGPRRMTLGVYPYPATLPPGTIERLHDVSPVVASLATALAVFLPLYLLYLLFLDGNRPIAVSRSPWFGGG